MPRPPGSSTMSHNAGVEATVKVGDGNIITNPEGERIEVVTHRTEANATTTTRTPLSFYDLPLILQDEVASYNTMRVFLRVVRIYVGALCVYVGRVYGRET